MNYELLFPNANEVVLAVSGINLLPAHADLTPNLRAVADHLQNILLAGGGDRASLISYLGSFPALDDYAAALDRLHPEAYLAQVQATLFANLGFTNSLLSCPSYLPFRGV